MPPSNKTSAETKYFAINFIYLIHNIHLIPPALKNECLSLPLLSAFVVSSSHSGIPSSSHSLLRFPYFSLSFHNVTLSDLSITLNIQHFFPIYTNIWDDAHRMPWWSTDKESKGACGCLSWSLVWFMPSATLYISLVSGVWMTCLPHYLTPAVVRSDTQVWPQGLCLWKWLQLLFLVLNIPWRIKNQHALLSQEHCGPTSTTLSTSPS